jgi:phage protein D
VRAAVPIHDGQDFYVPAFEVWRLDKQRALPPSVVRDVTQISYTDSLDRIDSYTLTLNNWDAERLAFKYSDSDEFLPGIELEIFMGYFGRDPLRRMISGRITAAEPTFPASGQPTLEIVGENVLRTLQNDKRSVAYRDMTDSEIAKAVGERLGIPVRTDPDAEAAEEHYEYVLQDNRPSIVFLLERAHRICYELYVEEHPQGRLLHFSPSLAVRRPTYELEYGRSLVRFQPNLDTTDQVGELTVRSWDPVNKRLIEHTARRSDLRTRGVGAARDQERIERSFQQAREVLTNYPVQTPQEARTVATELLECNKKHMLTATGSTVGLPDLRAGNFIVIKGVGERYSGRYFVTGTTHSIGEGGYTTEFTCRGEAI